jgi:serine/threonine protein kinase
MALKAGERNILKALYDFQGETATTIDDRQIADLAYMSVQEARDWLESLDSDGLVDRIRTTSGIAACITAKGRIELRLYLPFAEPVETIDDTPILDNVEWQLLRYLESNCISPDAEGSVNGPMICSDVRLNEDHLKTVGNSLIAYGVAGGRKGYKGVFTRMWVTPKGRQLVRRSHAGPLEYSGQVHSQEGKGAESVRTGFPTMPDPKPIACDLFISHASEDKVEVAQPLAEIFIERGLKVCYDEYTLMVGDSLRRNIDEGLAKCSYGLVILSKNFFFKEWPQTELDGLIAREDDSQKRILLVWHNISNNEVAAFSPILADKLGVSTANGLDIVVNRILPFFEVTGIPATATTPSAPRQFSESLDLQGELQRLNTTTSKRLENTAEVRELLQDVLEKLSELGMKKGVVNPQNSFTIRNEDERSAIKEMLGRFRQLPADQQKQFPALLNGLGKLQIGSGDFDGARQTFESVAQNTPEATAQAEAYFNAYRAALEEKKWDDALAAFQNAASLDSQRYTLFPMNRYRPIRILGSGGFGSVFLCHDCEENIEVAVKAFYGVALDRPTDDVIQEAMLLRKVDHPNVIKIKSCGYVDDKNKTRPYIVMEYFPGHSLHHYVVQSGPFSLAEFLSVAMQIAKGMFAVHQQHIIHRDLKPENVLVCRKGDIWHVKIIDFGLALREQVIETSMAANVAGNSSLGESVAGSLKFAPPEQMGELKDVKPGPYSDVYTFGRTCCYVLFGDQELRKRYWAQVPEALAEMLDRCTERELRHRLLNFESVVQVLEEVQKNQQQQEQPRQTDALVSPILEYGEWQLLEYLDSKCISPDGEGAINGQTICSDLGLDEDRLNQFGNNLVGYGVVDGRRDASSAPPHYRLHQKAAQSVLKSLLPDIGTDIKGNMRSRAQLLEASGYVNRPNDFDDLLGILDGELRLITPTDPEGKERDSSSPVQAGQKYYQLTHDYLVPALRKWLTRKQKGD